ncbi:MAG: hypothetical protein ACRD34_06460 [Bryobacteraceae bacterium]
MALEEQIAPEERVLTGTLRLLEKQGRGFRFIYFVWTVFVLALLGLAGAVTFYYWPVEALSPPHNLFQVELAGRRCRLYMAGRTLVADLAGFDDGLFAYLMFDYYRSRPALKQKEMMLIADESGPATVYRILLRLPNDLIAGVNELAELKAQRLTARIDYNWLTADEIKQDRHQTTVFIESYQGPAPEKLEKLHGRELQQYLRRFIRFKSTVDPRIYRNLDPIPSPLTRKQASRLAADMIAVSRFYNIPLELLIGIGAMENNFMNVPGDSNNTIWKRHAQPGDVVLKRRRGKVLVKNDSSGVWQITRQSLRYAHRLYLRDKKHDYSQLPERMRPPKKLDVTHVSQDVLTTYAGLLLSNLLDRFHGNVSLAVGAYNGGSRNPNAQYASRVEMIAKYARRMIGRAAELNREQVTKTEVNQSQAESGP